MEQQSIKFEQAMQRLEEIVNLLERGDAPLDQALSLFEEGAALVKTCNGLLDSAELQVVRLMKGADGAPQEVAYVPDNG